jgi:ABC transport system ATP-binding/permease protein
VSLIAIRDVKKRYGSREVLAGVSLAIGPQDRIGLIGANGAGKSTLLSILLGTEDPDDGEVIRRKGLSTSMVAQVPRLDPTATVAEVVTRARSAQAELFESLSQVETRMADASGDDLSRLIESQSELTERLSRMGAWDSAHRADAALSRLGVVGLDRVIGSLSLGERRRLSLAVSLIEPSDLLVLDEPTNHLDISAVE